MVDNGFVCARDLGTENVVGFPLSFLSRFCMEAILLGEVEFIPRWGAMCQGPQGLWIPTDAGVGVGRTL